MYKKSRFLYTCWLTCIEIRLSIHITARRTPAMPLLHPLEQLDLARFDTPAILKKLASSCRRV